jgi:hypothetical protein
MTSAWQLAARFDPASRGFSVPLDPANRYGVLPVSGPERAVQGSYPLLFLGRTLRRMAVKGF